MTARGGLAAAFDGVTSQPYTACCAADLSVVGYNNTCGKDWGASVVYTIDQFTLYAPSDNAGMGGAGGTTIKLQGSNDNTNWTDLYTTATELATAGSSVTVSSGITTSTAYRYHRFNMNGDGTHDVFLAEVLFYGTAQTTLTAALSTYAWSGVAATLHMPIAKMTAATASYAVNGVAVGLSGAFKVVAAGGSYAVSGVAIVIASAAAGASKFALRVSKYVLQKLRQSDPTLGD